MRHNSTKPSSTTKDSFQVEPNGRTPWRHMHVVSGCFVFFILIGNFVLAQAQNIGDDLTQLDSIGLRSLTNDAVLAVDQSGRPGQQITAGTDGETPVWAAKEANDSHVVALFTLNSTARTSQSPGATWDSAAALLSLISGATGGPSKRRRVPGSSFRPMDRV